MSLARIFSWCVETLMSSIVLMLMCKLPWLTDVTNFPDDSNGGCHIQLFAADIAVQMLWRCWVEQDDPKYWLVMLQSKTLYLRWDVQSSYRLCSSDVRDAMWSWDLQEVWCHFIWFQYSDVLWCGKWCTRIALMPAGGTTLRSSRWHAGTCLVMLKVMVVAADCCNCKMWQGRCDVRVHWQNHLDDMTWCWSYDSRSPISVDQVTVH